MNDTLVLVVAAAVVAFLFFKLKNEGAWADELGAGPRPGGASGSPQDTNALQHSIGAAAGVGACVAGGAALGAPQLGGALAPACGALGSFVAPYVAKGFVAGAKAVASGAKFTAEKVYEGAKIATNTGQTILSNPFAITPMATGAAAKVAGAGASLLDRGATTLWNKAPAPVKLAAAPLYATTKVTTTAVKAVAPVVTKAAGALASGTKAATSAVASGVNKVLGFL